MGKILKLSEKHKKYLFDRPDDKHIVDIKLNSGVYLRRRLVEELQYIELKDGEDISIEDIKSLFLYKEYESKKKFSKEFNSKLSTIQIDRNLHKELKQFLIPKELTIREWIEQLIKDKMDV